METVLIVEDEPHLRVFLRTTLERKGYAVVEAENGVQALELVGAHSVDLVIADIVMPRMGGRELAWRLSESAPHIPVILVSGMLPQDHVDRDVSPAAYLGKPFTQAEILLTVARVLQR
jgi:CheY-like chemotaxis protein